jgi:hypothetical protein
LAIYGIFAHDGEHTFQENFRVEPGDDPRIAGARHLASAWDVDLGQYATIEKYIDGLDEFEVEPASADQSILDLLDGVGAFLDGSGDAASLARLREAYDLARGHRDRYEPETRTPAVIYMPLDEAKALLDRSCGTEAYAPQTHGEPWCVANLPLSAASGAVSYTDVGVERIDMPEDVGIEGPGFASDDEAVEHLRTRAAAGSDLHAQALRIDHAANSIRFHLWGRDMVNSRIGPSIAA